MRPPKRSTVVILLLALAVALLSVTAAVAAAPHGPQHGVKAPKLKAVPKVVKVKSTKKPPKNVKFRGQRMPGGITTGPQRTRVRRFRTPSGPLGNEWVPDHACRAASGGGRRERPVPGPIPGKAPPTRGDTP